MKIIADQYKRFHYTVNQDSTPIENRYWFTRTKQKIKFGDMTNTHVINGYKYYLKKYKKSIILQIFLIKNKKNLNPKQLSQCIKHYFNIKRKYLLFTKEIKRREFWSSLY